MEICNNYTKTVKEMVNEKIYILKDFGVVNNGNKSVIKKQLEDALDAHPDCNLQTVLDQKANAIIFCYLDGRQEVEEKTRAAGYYNKLKAIYPQADAVYEDAIVDNIGKEGLALLRKERYIESCGLINDRKLYAMR